MESKPASAEKPNHLQYIREFRVEPCPLFKQHQCQQHRPYTCFNWHFANQRRRRPCRKADGSFNYSPDIYCEKYDENTGICPDGDTCVYLHRVSGDVERKYHLRYYKTAQCVHGTDSRGQCVKNGPHCAFAHSAADLRQAQHDQNEAAYVASLNEADGRDRTAFVIEDPQWHCQDHVLSCYKTELCRKPARLCRQGYACPFYHNSKDRRRPPAKYKYRSTPCPAAKTVDEWLDPEMCENGDNCTYCHTRTEQQFHPEIYKSTKCNDMLEHGYCPRAVFCAFAHHDAELHIPRTPYVHTSHHSPTAGGTNDSPTDSSRFGSPSSINGPSTPTYSEALKIKMLENQRSNDIANMLSSSCPKQPLYDMCDISPTRNDKNAGRIRTHSLNMGHLDLGTKRCSITNFEMGAAPLGTSLPAHSSLCRSDSGFNALPSNFEELSLDLGTIDENRSNRMGSDFFINNALSSPMRIPGSDSYQTSPLTSYGETLLQSGSKMSLNSPVPSNVFSPFPTNVLAEAALIEELSKTKEELNAHHEKVAVWEEGLKQARQACEAWKSDAEIYKLMAEKAEQDKKKAQFERDQAVQQLEALKLRMAANDGEVPRIPVSSPQPFNMFGAETEAACARCGKERSRAEKNGCPVCSAT